MDHNRRRLAGLLALALMGLAISMVLAAFEIGLVATIWDPIFGDGSRRVLTSEPARALPVPDAVVGAVAYAVEAVLTILAAVVARRPMSGLIELALGALAAAMAVAGVVLLVVQAFGLGTGCSLCIASAVVSWLAAALAVPRAWEIARGVLAADGAGDERAHPVAR
jgi:uncharacterized membrane protein